MPGETSEYAYDSLIVAAGRRTVVLRPRRVRRASLRAMKTIDDALELRRARSTAPSRCAENSADPAIHASSWLTFVDRRRAVRPASSSPARSASWPCRSLTRDFRQHRPLRRFASSWSTGARSLPRQLRRPALRAGARPSSRQHGRRAQAWGSAWCGTSTSVRGRHRGPPTAKEGDSTCGTVIWAAGVQASPLAKACWPRPTGARDRTVTGRIAVLPDLTLPGHPEVFAVGDMASHQRPARGLRGRHAGRPPRRQHHQPHA